MEVAERGRGGSDLARGRGVRPGGGPENGAWRGSEWVRRSREGGSGRAERASGRRGSRDGIALGRVVACADLSGLDGCPYSIIVRIRCHKTTFMKIIKGGEVEYV